MSAGRRAAAQLHADGAGRGGEDHAFVGVLPEAGVAPPAVDRLLEVADHREAEGGEPRRHVVDAAWNRRCDSCIRRLVDGDRAVRRS